MKQDEPSVFMWAGTMLATARVPSASLPVHEPQTFQWLRCLTQQHLYSANEGTYGQ